MTKHEINEINTRQNAYFKSGSTLDIKARRDALKRLYASIVRNEGRIKAALYSDLGKSGDESYMCEHRRP